MPLGPHACSSAVATQIVPDRIRSSPMAEVKQGCCWLESEVHYIYIYRTHGATRTAPHDSWPATHAVKPSTGGLAVACWPVLPGCCASRLLAGPVCQARAKQAVASPCARRQQHEQRQRSRWRSGRGGGGPPRVPRWWSTAGPRPNPAGDRMAAEMLEGSAPAATAWRRGRCGAVALPAVSELIMVAMVAAASSGRRSVCWGVVELVAMKG